jgi:WS/DGAT/MGAT family acyltransferase
MTDWRTPPAKLSHRLSAQDASFLYGESRSGPLHIGAATIFEGRIDYDELLARMDARMHLLPRYRQRVVFAPLNIANATLEDDPEFDLRNHIKNHSLPEGTNDDEFMRVAMREFAPMLDRRRPLWELHLFRGLENNRSAALWKMHHCLVDGVSGMELLNTALDLRADAPDPEPPLKPFGPAPLPGLAKSFATALIDLVQERINEARAAAEMLEAPRVAAERMASMANIAGRMAQMFSRPIAAAPWNAGLVGPERSLAYLKVSFGELRAIRNALGGTANDVVLAVLGEAAARYLAYHGIKNGDPIRIGCPVNVRRDSENGALGNRVSMMFPELSAAPMDVRERLRAVARETMKIKRRGEPQAFELLLSAAAMIPPGIVGPGAAVATAAVDAAARLSGIAPGLARIFTPPSSGVNFIATNVPGAQVPLFLAGRRMIGMIGCVPLAGNLGYNVAIVSYNQNLAFGMMAEPRLMPDVERMRSYAAEVFGELMAAANNHEAASRRSGGDHKGAATAPAAA